MRRVAAVAVFLQTLLVFASHGVAQDPRQRQAAGEAYDRGTAAYLDGAYEEAAQWFETANRLSPAAPALMQAIRAYEHANNLTRATTLALALSRIYDDDKAATDFASEFLDKYQSTLLRVEVSCDEDCKLDVDGKLEEFLSFFVEPGKPHHLTATFESGSKRAQVEGQAGETKTVEFQAPPPPPVAKQAPVHPIESSAPVDRSPAPLPPLYTFIGVGLTAALGIATVVSGLDADAGVPKYEKAATAYNECKQAMPGAACTQEGDAAHKLLTQGQARELRTNVLIGATALAAVGTGVVALFLTNWSGDEDKPAHARLRIEPRPGGAMSVIEGRF